jgi:uncharacterized protein (DUF2252 family)
MPRETLLNAPPAGSSEIAKRITAFDQGRDPERLAMKYALMRKDAFVFLRGTCQIFYEDLDASVLPDSPLVWCCGDLHLQNFGTYKGDNRLVYFDLNDFDEACLAPTAWELVRFLTSVLVGGKTLGMDRATCKAMMQQFLAGYAEALRVGKAKWLERATSQGVIRDLLTQLRKRKQKKFIASRTYIAKGKRRLIINGKQTLALEKGQIKMLREFMAGFAEQQNNPSFYRLRDAARRVAGTGSLGLERYALLVEGHGDVRQENDGQFLLDLKHEPGSAVVAAKPSLAQPPWHSEGERVVTVQHEVEAISPALLQAVELHGKSFVIHELMPTADRLDISNWRGDVAGFEDAMRVMGHIVAWGNLRSSARRGSAGPEELIAFGNQTRWMKPLLDCASECAKRIQKQWREYMAA